MNSSFHDICYFSAHSCYMWCKLATTDSKCIALDCLFFARHSGNFDTLCWHGSNTVDRHLLVYHNVPSSEKSHNWGSHGIHAKILIANFPPCQQVVIWFLVKKCSFGQQLSQQTPVPRFPSHLAPFNPRRQWVGESVMGKDGAPPWPGKDWGCRRTAGQVFWAAHKGVSPGCSAWPTSISVPGEINGKMWPKQSNITFMAGTCCNNGAQGGFPISLLKMRHSLQLIPTLNECLLLAAYLSVAVEID